MYVYSVTLDCGPGLPDWSCAGFRMNHYDVSDTDRGYALMIDALDSIFGGHRLRKTLGKHLERLRAYVGEIGGFACEAVKWNMPTDCGCVPKVCSCDFLPVAASATRWLGL